MRSCTKNTTVNADTEANRSNYLKKSALLFACCYKIDFKRLSGYFVKFRLEFTPNTMLTKSLRVAVNKGQHVFFITFLRLEN